MNITFTDIYQIGDVLEKPKPASASVPQWYKDIESYVDGKKEPTIDGIFANETVKKCMPVFDMITAGYIITSPADVYVRQIDGMPYYNWSGYDALGFHSTEQTVGHPSINGSDPSPKWINPWAIKTPKGWSTLFIQPAHRESLFTILPGIVDTDTYTNPVNFPFRLNDNSFEGMIPAGTPIAQVIPIKRENWNMSFGSSKEINEQKLITAKMQTVYYDRYKRFWWNKKQYK
jgi:hypothetical protein